jgi:hypothetical protein
LSRVPCPPVHLRSSAARFPDLFKSPPPTPLLMILASLFAVVETCTVFADSVVQCFGSQETLPSLSSLTGSHACVGIARTGKGLCSGASWRDAVQTSASRLSPSGSVRGFRSLLSHPSCHSTAGWPLQLCCGPPWSAFCGCTVAAGAGDQVGLVCL